MVRKNEDSETCPWEKVNESFHIKLLMKYAMIQNAWYKLGYEKFYLVYLCNFLSDILIGYFSSRNELRFFCQAFISGIFLLGIFNETFSISLIHQAFSSDNFSPVISNWLFWLLILFTRQSYGNHPFNHWMLFK